MKAMEKIRLSKERVNLIADLKSGNLKGMAKIRASKRVVEIVVLLGGAGTPIEAFVEFEPDGRLEANILPDEKERLAAKYPILNEFISEMKKQDFVLNASIGWGGASAVFDNTVGERVEISLNVVKSRSDTSTAGKIAIQQYKSSGYEYYGIFEVSTSGIQDAIKAARAMLQPATNPLYQSVIVEPKYGDKVQVTGVVESSKDSPNLKFIRDDSGESVTIFSQFGKSLKKGMTIKAELKWTGLATGWAYSQLLEIVSDPLAGTRVEPVRKKKALSVADAGNLLYEMDGNQTNTATLQEGWGGSTTYTRDEVLAVLATVQPTTNPLYQSVLDGAAITIDLVKQVRAEGQKDPDHPQLRPAVRVIVDAVKAMAA
jgi:hypothetical protein